MILAGGHRHGISLSHSWMIGDKDDDIRAGLATGMRTIRIGPESGGVVPHFHAASLFEASRIIVSRKQEI